MATPVHFVVPDWGFSPEGREVHKSLIDRQTGRRKRFGLLEKPSFSPQAVPEEFPYKIFISGKGGVGKTSSACKLTGNDIPKHHSETPGLQTWDVYWPAKIKDIGKTVMFHLQFWDAGENAVKKFDHVLPACKERADGVLFLFSFTDKSSFDDIPQQMARVLDAETNAAKFVLGTKLDLHGHGEVTQRDVQGFESHWKTPVMSIRNVEAPNGETDVAEVAPILNYLCDQLWLRDQVLAGRVSPVDYAFEPRMKLS